MFVSIEPNYSELSKALENGFLSPEQLAMLRETPEKLSEVITHWPFQHGVVIPVKVNVVSSRKEDGVTYISFRKTAIGDYVCLTPNYLYEIHIYDLPWYERLIPQLEEIGFRKCSDGYYRKDDDNECAFFFQLTRPEPGVSEGEVIIKVTKSETEDNVTELIDTHLQIKGLGMEYDIPQRVADLFETIGY